MPAASPFSQWFYNLTGIETAGVERDVSKAARGAVDKSIEFAEGIGRVAGDAGAGLIDFASGPVLGWRFYDAGPGVGETVRSVGTTVRLVAVVALVAAVVWLFGPAIRSGASAVGRAFK